MKAEKWVKEKVDQKERSGIEDLDNKREVKIKSLASDRNA